MLNMRTTIDIPDELFRRVKAEAALRGQSLKTFVLNALQNEFSAKQAPAKRRANLPLVKSKESNYDISAERIADILEREDHELSAGH